MSNLEAHVDRLVAEVAAGRMTQEEARSFLRNTVTEAVAQASPPPSSSPSSGTDIDLAIRALVREGRTEEQAVNAVREAGTQIFQAQIAEQRRLDEAAARAAADKAFRNSPEGRRAAAAASIEAQAAKKRDAQLARQFLVDQGVLSADDDSDLLSDDEAIEAAFGTTPSDEDLANNLAANAEAANRGEQP